jgi:hypothetical protein
MQRILLLALIVSYTFLSLDLNVRAHYCHGELAWFQINSIGSTGCCSHKPPAKDQCCDDEVLDIDFEVDQQLTPIQFHKVAQQDFDFSCGLPVGNNHSLLDGSASILTSDRAPPLLRNLRISYCSLIYYG